MEMSCRNGAAPGSGARLEASYSQNVKRQDDTSKPQVKGAEFYPRRVRLILEAEEIEQSARKLESLDVMELAPLVRRLVRVWLLNEAARFRDMAYKLDQPQRRAA
jgi:hypothetical protein